MLIRCVLDIAEVGRSNKKEREVNEICELELVEIIERKTETQTRLTNMEKTLKYYLSELPEKEMLDATA